MGAQRGDREGDLRARELFHYFQPDNPALIPNGQRDRRTCESPTIEKQSPNLVLTALAQLAALKLGVQRAVIRYDFFPLPCIRRQFTDCAHILNTFPAIQDSSFHEIVTYSVILQLNRPRDTLRCSRRITITQFGKQ